MPLITKASAVTAALRERLDRIKPDGGYLTDLRGVYVPSETVQDRAPLPYALIRPASDVRTGLAGIQATRVRQFEIEVVFPKSAEEDALSAVHVDILRALGIGQELPERKFPGLLEEEDSAEFRWASSGEKTHSITIAIGVLYAETYN